MSKMQMLIDIEEKFYIVKRYIIAVKRYSIIPIILGLSLAFMLISVPAISQSQLPNTIRLGVRTLAYPIGNNINEKGTKAGGFCGIFGDELKQELAEKGQIINVKYVRIVNQHLNRDYPRFDGLKKGIIDIECGPNSISSNTIPTADGIQFSNVFHKTGVKLLLKKDLAQKLKSNHENLKNVKIGVVQGTTTLNVLQSIYKVSEYESGDKALDAIDKNQIEAFASDALIVWTLLNKGVDEPKREFRLPYKNSAYAIYPEDSYLTEATEQYAMAVKEETPFKNELLTAINNTLNRDKISKAQEDLKKDESTKIFVLDEFIKSLYPIIFCIEIMIVLVIIVFIKIRISGNPNPIPVPQPSPIPPNPNPEIRNFLLKFFIGFLMALIQIAIIIFKPIHQPIYVLLLGILVIAFGLWTLL